MKCRLVLCHVNLDNGRQLTLSTLPAQQNWKPHSRPRPWKDAVPHGAQRFILPFLLIALSLYERVNVRGTMVLLEMARRSGIGKFIFASSSSIYGIANRVPFSEMDAENQPISPYAATKIAGEKICFTYPHLYNIRTSCLRFFTVYGPRQRPDLAIHKFADLIERGKPIPKFGDGTRGATTRFAGISSTGLWLHCTTIAVSRFSTLGTHTPSI